MWFLLGMMETWKENAYEKAACNVVKQSGLFYSARQA